MCDGKVLARYATLYLQIFRCVALSRVIYIYNVRTLSTITNVTLQRATMDPSVTRYACGSGTTLEMNPIIRLFIEFFCSKTVPQ